MGSRMIRVAYLGLETGFPIYPQYPLLQESCVLLLIIKESDFQTRSEAKYGKLVEACRIRAY